MENASAAEPPALTRETLEQIQRYCSYGWIWGVIVKLVNRTFHTAYTAAELRRLSEQLLG